MVGRELRAEDHGSNFARALIAFFMNAALIVAPGFLGGLAVFFVLQSFGEGIGSGLRSFAAVVFPLMVLAFVKAGQVVSDKAGHTADDPAGGVLSEGRDRAAPYCLGLVVGSLGYVIMVGVPNL